MVERNETPLRGRSPNPLTQWRRRSIHIAAGRLLDRPTNLHLKCSSESAPRWGGLPCGISSLRVILLTKVPSRGFITRFTWQVSENGNIGLGQSITLRRHSTLRKLKANPSHDTDLRAIGYSCCERCRISADSGSESSGPPE